MKLLSIILLCLSGCIVTDYVTRREFNDHTNRESYCRLRVQDYTKALHCCYDSVLCHDYSGQSEEEWSENPGDAEEEYKIFWCNFVKDYERECI